jgi:hypothetical protein
LSLAKALSSRGTRATAMARSKVCAGRAAPAVLPCPQALARPIARFAERRSACGPQVRPRAPAKILAPGRSCVSDTASHANSLVWPVVTDRKSDIIQAASVLQGRACSRTSPPPAGRGSHRASRAAEIRLRGWGGRIRTFAFQGRNSPHSTAVRQPDGGGLGAVGTRVSSRAPRTEPHVRLSRMRLPPRVCDGKAIARPGM